MRYNNAEHTGSFDISGSWIIPNGTTGSIANPVSGSTFLVYTLLSLVK
jgi:hypothetical protein